MAGSSLNIKESRIIFSNPEGDTVLLDCAKLLSNKSRVPMHRLPGQSHLTIPDTLVKLFKLQQASAGDLAFPFGVIDALLAARLIRSASPVKVLEYGSGQGELSVHLAELLGVFHDESRLVCAYDSIEPEWMERISRVEHLPKISFLAGDFGELGLQSGSFDIVVLNGRVNFPDPCEVTADALRLSREDGMIVCYADSSPLLESIFKLFFEERKEFALQPTQKILLADTRKACWRIEGPPCVDAGKTAELVRRSIKSGRKAALSALKSLDKDLKAAVRQKETSKKIQLLEQKETLLEYITRS